MTTAAPRLLIDRHVGHYAAAAMLGCARQTVLAYATRGMLTPHQIAGRTVFLRGEVEALRDKLARNRKTRGAR
jgi:hypothetical protein